MSHTNDIGPLIDSYLSNNCSPEEYKKIVDILKNPENDSVLQFLLSKRWMEMETNAIELSELDKKDIRQSLSNIHHEINLNRETWESGSNFKKLTRVLVNIAATLFFPVLFVSIWYFLNSRNPYQPTDSYITINTPTGSKLRSELPDGTVVWQNSGSTIKYPQNFNKTNRQVILDGEANFEVTSDKLHPFYVKTRDLLIEVTGTKFNVMDYEDEETSSIVLETGVISVQRLGSSSSMKYKLIPGDRLENSRTSGGRLYHDIDVEKYISWIDGKLIFKDDPLDEVLKRLGRWYNVDIVVNDPKGKFSKLPFTMTIQYESLAQILEYLKHAVPITIREERLESLENGGFNKQKYYFEPRKYN